jgi:hypothetical protein
VKLFFCAYCFHWDAVNIFNKKRSAHMHCDVRHQFQRILIRSVISFKVLIRSNISFGEFRYEKKSENDSVVIK